MRSVGAFSTNIQKLVRQLADFERVVSDEIGRLRGRHAAPDYRATLRGGYPTAASSWDLTGTGEFIQTSVIAPVGINWDITDWCTPERRLIEIGVKCNGGRVSGHGSLPAIMPRVVLYGHPQDGATATETLGSRTDTSSDVSQYNTTHVVSTPMNLQLRYGWLYRVVFLGEAGAGASANELGVYLVYARFAP